MSHFGVLVVGDVEEQLAPFHEFECTENDDQYVQDLDITDEVRLEFDNEDEESDIIKYCEEWRGIKKVPFGESPDLAGIHKYGYILVDSDNKLVKAIDRTNPNKKWDWYQIGGRWKGYLLHKNGNRVDSLSKGNWAIDQLIEQVTTEANKEFDRFEEVTKGLPMARAWDELLQDKSFDDIQKRKEFYHNQPMIKAWSEANKNVWMDAFGPFSRGRNHYIESEIFASIIPYAYVNNQTWKAIGEMGWFGVSTNEVDDEISWCKQTLEEIKSLPDDTIITIVDCHI